MRKSALLTAAGLGLALGLIGPAGPANADAVDDLIDPIVCPIFASLRGTYPTQEPNITFRPDGDVGVRAGEYVLIWDCPPYEN